MKAMKRELDAVRAPKVDQNNYYGLYYRFQKVVDGLLLYYRGAN